MAGRKRCTKPTEHSPKKMKRKSKKNAELPMDLIVVILLRLPVKSLVKFSVTSRLMYSLIYHPCFVFLHLKLAERNGGYLMKANNRGLKNCQVQKLNPLCFFRENEPTVQVFQPPEVGGGHHSIASSCNGLICLLNFKEWNQPICIYNPATRESVQLPLPSPFPTDDATVVYDSTINSYKVFRLYTSKDSHPAETRFEAFTLGQSSKSWRQKGILPNNFIYASKHVKAHGAVNWLFGERNSLHSVLSIDIITETWKVHPIPNIDVRYRIFLIELVGHLAMCGMTLDMKKIVIWLLKDAKNSTWTMLLSFDSPNWMTRSADVQTCVCPTGSLPLLIWRGRNKLVFYDPRTSETKRVDTSPASNGWVDLHVIDHVESLVPCKARWGPVQWPEINEILYNYFPQAVGRPKTETEYHAEVLKWELELQGSKEGPEEVTDDQS